ncbi:MAG: dienelactone hydrolase family protein [Rhodospirillaceae bacterium]|nr:dienelactone hydrolase family protein [Rhodospirillaceae bacterium]
MTIDHDVCGEECFNVTRRTFGALALSTGITAAAGAQVALPVTEIDVVIKTPDGSCDAVMLHPSAGAHPAVLMWPDIGGLRPVFREMGRRLAAEGYSVLVPNPFYRQIKAPMPADIPREERMKLREALFAEGAAEKDAAVFMLFLATHASVKNPGRMGTAGYCMGGPLTLRTAAAQAHHVAAAASFHGSGLATDQPNSPHLLIPRIRAKYLICVAENDDARDPDAKTKLRAVFEAAKNPADIEVYTGANHGWCVPGGQVYNEAQAEKAWGKMLALFKSTLV